MNPAEQYILDQEEPFRAILLHLQLLIEHTVPDAEMLYKYKIPFYYIGKTPFCYLNCTKGYVDLGVEEGAKLVVDSTAATPVLTRPLELGADIVMHSATKYLNGHGDVVAGALVGRNDDEMWQALRDVRANGGAIMGSFEAWLLQRGMRTLFLRVQRAAESAAAIADHFANDPRVAAVLYPGLPDHPGHDVAARQMRGGFGGMLSLRVNGGREAALATAARCEVFVRATSLGGVESLIEHRRSIEGDDSPIPEDLLRLSVGIESKDDLIADLDRALGETN